MNAYINAVSRYDHLAVPMEHCIIVFGGTWVYGQPYSIETIWSYNLYTEAWDEHSVSMEEITEQLGKQVKYFYPTRYCACAAAIGTDIFLFGAMAQTEGLRIAHIDYPTNPLLKLSRNHQGEFSWSCIKYQSTIKSFKNAYQTGWAYAEKLWIFGGAGVFVDDYLNDNGGFSWATSHYNNQLLCFDPSCEKWTNPQSSGNIPEPRAGHSTAILRDTVWMIGGINLRNLRLDDLYQLDMHSLVWTKMEIMEPKPSAIKFVSLIAFSDGQLMLQGNFTGDNGMIASEGWVLDTLSASWRKHETAPKDKRPRHSHTATPGINNSVVIIGGHGPDRSKSSNSLKTLHVMLQPKSLQQLAVKTVYKHKAKLPCKALPKSLRSLLGFL